MDSEQARRALKMLADEQQEVLILRFGQGLSLQETADIMGKQVGAVKSLQFRAVNTLRQVLSQV
jgi:RNA polymerase sigma-70 factor (ECF subfamily)